MRKAVKLCSACRVNLHVRELRGGVIERVVRRRKHASRVLIFKNEGSIRNLHVACREEYAIRAGVGIFTAVYNDAVTCLVFDRADEGTLCDDLNVFALNEEVCGVSFTNTDEDLGRGVDDLRAGNGGLDRELISVIVLNRVYIVAY